MMEATLSNTMLADQAIAAPAIPRCGISARLRPTLMTRATPTLNSCQALRPPISRTTWTLPVPRLTIMARDRMTSALWPPVKSAPKARRTSGANVARIRYAGHEAATSHHVIVWWSSSARPLSPRASKSRARKKKATFPVMKKVLTSPTMRSLKKKSWPAWMSTWSNRAVNSPRPCVMPM